MDFTFSEAHAAVADLARRLFTERVTGASLKALEDAGEARFDAKLWAELAATGLLGTAIPEAHGGSGHGLLELYALLQEAGSAVAPVPLFATLVLGALPIAELGTPAQKARLLPRVAAGEVILTAALADGSTDLTEPVTTARRDGDGYRVTGVKVCVQAAHLAERVLVPALSAEGVCLLLVSPTAPGVALEPQIATTGEPLSEMTMTDVAVPADDVLAGPDRGAEGLAWLVDRATVALCAIELGVILRALAMTASYAATRHQFDRPIGTFQAVSQRAGDAFIDVECVRLSMLQAAWRLAEGLPAGTSVAMAKIWAGEAGHRVVFAAQHLHAGIGFDRDYPLHRYYLAHRQLSLTLGSAAVHLERLGRALAG